MDLKVGTDGEFIAARALRTCKIPVVEVVPVTARASGSHVETALGLC